MTAAASPAARVLRALPPVDGNDEAELDAQGAWEPPMPLGTAHRALPAFPIDALPDWVAEHVAAVTEFTQTPPDLPACIALAALATAGGGKAIVRIRHGWTEPVNLFVLVALPPGSRKSDVFREMIRPLRTAELELITQAEPLIEEAKVARRIAEREAEKAERTASTSDPISIALATEAAVNAQRIQVPAQPQLIADNVTVEKAATILSEQGGRLAVLAPEGGIIAILAGRYSGTPDFDVFLRGHAGDWLLVDRQGRESQRIEHAYLTLGLAVQPEIIRDLAKVPGAKEKGLLGRFLYSLPANTVGSRKIRTDPIPDLVAHTYSTRLSALVHTLAEQSEPAVLTFDHDADEAMLNLQTEIEPKLGPRGAWHHIADWAAKYAGATARIAGLLHLADQPTTFQRPITAATFDRARRLGSYYLAHALATFDHMGSDTDIDNARALLAWITTEHLNQFTRRDAHRANRARFRKATDIDPALALLEDHGYIRQAPAVDRPGAGRKPSPVYWIHPIHRTDHVSPDGAHNGQN